MTDSAKHVLHIVPAITEESSGPSYTVTRLCESLIAEGHDVTLGVLDWGPSTFAPPYVRRFPLGLGPHRLGRSPAMWRWLKAAVASGTVGIVHSHGMWQMAGVYPGWACQGQKQAKLIVSPRGSFSQWAFVSGSPVKRLFWPLVQRPALAGCVCFHATAASEYRDIRRMDFTQPIAVIPNGIDIPDLLPRVESPIRTVLFLGRIHPVKGLDWLLQAWSVLQGRFPHWRLRIVGSDAGYLGGSGYSLKMKDLAASLGLDRVAFPGELRGPEKLAAYREAELFVLPSHTENFGIAVAEALAMGIPAVVSKGAPWQGLEANGCGWWVDLDKDALIHSLAEAMSLSPGELAKMGQLGRAWMTRNFSWQRIGNMMGQTYAWLEGRASAPAFVKFD
jgi:glycosyltransferase involved in cell wall biosynthesis